MALLYLILFGMELRMLRRVHLQVHFCAAATTRFVLRAARHVKQPLLPLCIRKKRGVV